MKISLKRNFSNSGDCASTAVVRKIYFSGTVRASIGGANEARNFVSSLGAVEAEPNNSKGIELLVVILEQNKHF